MQVHWATLQFSLASTDTRAFSILKETVFFGRKEFSNTNQILLVDDLNINQEVSNLNEVWVTFFILARVAI